MREIPEEIKKNPIKRWALDEETFFACGACHILAFVLLTKFEFQNQGYEAIWIKPLFSKKGNHIFISNGTNSIDWQGMQKEDLLLKNHKDFFLKKYPNWNYEIIKIPTGVLISEEMSRKYTGLHLRQPDQFLHNPIPRAINFIQNKILLFSQ